MCGNFNFFQLQKEMRKWELVVRICESNTELSSLETGFKIMADLLPQPLSDGIIGVKAIICKDIVMILSKKKSFKILIHLPL